MELIAKGYGLQPSAKMTCYIRIFPHIPVSFDYNLEWLPEWKWLNYAPNYIGSCHGCWQAEHSDRIFLFLHYSSYVQCLYQIEKPKDNFSVTDTLIYVSEVIKPHIQAVSIFFHLPRSVSGPHSMFIYPIYSSYANIRCFKISVTMLAWERTIDNGGLVLMVVEETIVICGLLSLKIDYLLWVLA